MANQYKKTLQGREKGRSQPAEALGPEEWHGSESIGHSFGLMSPRLEAGEATALKCHRQNKSLLSEDKELGGQGQPSEPENF